MDFLTCLLIDCGKKAKNNLTKELAAYDVTCRQVVVLRTLENTAITAKVIGGQTSIDKATLSAMLKILEERSIITYHSSEKDKREKIYSLTQKGVDLLPKVIAIEDQFQKNMFSHLSDDEREKLTEYLLSLKENF